MREMRSEDLDVISSIYFAAFEADSIETGVPAGFRGGDEAARGIIGACLADPSIYKLVAVDVSGKLLGAAFMHSGKRSSLFFGSSELQWGNFTRGHCSTMSLAIVRFVTITHTLRMQTGALNTDVAGTHIQAVGPVFVDIETSNKGIGKALMQEIVDHAKKMNAPSIRLTTVPTFHSFIPSGKT